MRLETPQRRQHSISLTPLIDVVFILLVFFMLATSFTDWRPITLATGTSTPSPGHKPPAVVRIDAQGELSYQAEHYGNARILARRLSEAHAEGAIAAVIVQPDAEASLEATVSALDALSGAGVTPISLASGGAESQP